MEYEVGKRDDLGAILELYKQWNPKIDIFADFSIEEANKVWDKIESNNIKYFLAKDNNKVIATCFICIIPNLANSGKPIGYIENVITDEKYRRKGIGKKIIEMAIKFAKEEKCNRVVLLSASKKIEAHKFYDSLGFCGESQKGFELRF